MKDAQRASLDLTETFSRMETEHRVAAIPGWILDQGNLRKDFAHTSLDKAARFARAVARLSVRFERPVTLSLEGASVEIFMSRIGAGLSRGDLRFALRLNATSKKINVPAAQAPATRKAYEK